MPRAETKTLVTNYSYNSSSYSSSSYGHGSQSPDPHDQLSPITPASSQPSTAANAKKKHICSVCERSFSTSGHLARHSRVHTGERNHKCPFPGCETRCSRQDNLQQHYRIHLSPGSRRTSARNSMRNGAKRGAAATTAALAVTEPPSSPPPLSQPPALEPARVYSHHSPPPDSPPPLAQATLPATAHLPSTSSGRSSASSSPISAYPPSSHLVSMPSQNAPQQYNSYRTGTATYHEASQGSYPTFVHTTAVTQPSTTSSNSYTSYSGSQHANYNSQSSSHQIQHDNPAPVTTSRHSISHISHPTPYSQNQHHNSNTEPPSPASPHHPVSPHASAPPTPPYAYESQGYHSHHHNGTNGTMLSHSHGHMSSQHSYQGYPPSSMVPQHQHQHQRYASPSPTLPPIQDARYFRRGETRSYQAHPQNQISTDYNQYTSMNHLGHRSWKDGGMHKDVGALVQ